MRTNSNIFLVSAGLIFITLASCSGGEAYTHFYHIANGKWHRDSVLVFAIDSLIHPVGRSYDVTVELTINRSYPYRDMWVMVNQDLIDSVAHTDTIRYLLADEHGKWLGGSTGGLSQFSFPYFSFTPRDSVNHYRLTIRQAMDDGLLRGVEKVGIKLVEPHASGFCVVKRKR